MAQQSGTVGGTASSPFSGFGSGYDYSTGVTFDSQGITSGGINSATGTFYTIQPYHLVSFTFYWRISNSATYRLEIDDNDALSSPLYSSATYTVSDDTSRTVNPNLAIFASTTYYCGFEKRNATTINWYRQADGSDGANGNNQIYENGTAVGSWAGTSQRMAFTWRTAPTAPTISITNANITATSAIINVTAPTDNGGAAINGYRVMGKITGAADSTYVSLGKITANAATSFLDLSTFPISDFLSPNTSYTLAVSALNATTDTHNTDYSVITAHTGTQAIVSFTTKALTPFVYNGATMVRSTVKVRSASSTWIDPIAVKVYDGNSWEYLK
jgi:hypothetical protein